MAVAERKSDFKLITGTAHLTLSGQLLDVFSEDSRKNRPRYNGPVLC